MKSLYLIPVLLTVSIYASSQNNLGFSYSFSLPQQEMKSNIRPVHSLGFNFISSFKQLSNLSWGIEVGFGQYANFTKAQHIEFPDGSGFDSKVNYSSNVASAGILTRYQFFKDAKVNPYLAGKLGYANFFSKVLIYDSDDPNSCRPLDKKTPIADHSFFASYGGGLQIDISSRKKPKNAWLDISISQLHGTELSYIDIKDIKEHDHIDPNNPPAPISDKITPLNIKFINVATQTIHEHQLAQVYTSPLRLLEMKAGVLWNLNSLCAHK